MTAKQIAVQSPDRCSAGRMWSTNLSLWASDSLAAIVRSSIRSESTPTDTAIDTMRKWVANASASPAANPAGSHATAIRRSGCEPRFASSSSGRAPETNGPWART